MASVRADVMIALPKKKAHLVCELLSLVIPRRIELRLPG